MKRILLLILLLGGLGNVSMAQRHMKLTLRYDAAVKRYSVLAKCDFTESRFLWGPSQITVVLPTNGVVKKLRVSSVSGGAWSDESTVYRPQAQPENDFHGMDTRGGEVFNVVTGKELVVFYFTLPASINPKGVRLFVNGKDPNSTQSGMMGGDFWNTIVDRTGEDIFTGLYIIDNEGVEEFIPSVPPPVTTPPVTTPPVTTPPVTTPPVTTPPVTTPPVTTPPVTTPPVTTPPVTTPPVTTPPVTTPPVTTPPVTTPPVVFPPVTTPPVTTPPVVFPPETNAFVVNVYPNVVTDHYFRVLVWGNNILPDEELLVTVTDDTGKKVMSVEGTNRSLARKRLKLPLNISSKLLTIRVISDKGVVAKRIIVR